MKKQLLLFLFGFLFVGLLTNAQSTFDDKKRESTATAKTAQNISFDFSKLNVKAKQSVITKGRTNYQMPSVFSLKGAPSLYEHRVLKSSEEGLPVFIESKATEPAKISAKSQSAENVGANYLEDIKEILRVANPSEEFQNISKKVDDLGQIHIKMQQVYKGVKVYGSEVVLHLNKKRQVQAFNGRSKPTPKLESVTPKISFHKALSNIEIDLGKALPKTITAKSRLSDLLTPSSPEEELIIYSLNGQDILTRHITVFPSVMDRWEYFIDANTGKVIDKYYHTCTFHYDFNEEHKEKKNPRPLPPTNTSGADLNGVNRQLNTWSNGTQNYLIDTSKPMFNAGQSELPDNPVGGIMTLDLRGEASQPGVQIFHVTSSGNTWNNANGVSAHYNADISYEYFRTTFNRNSINGQGGSVISFINVGDEEGGALENAFWNGKAMFYGNGRVAFKPFAGALDVGGHEMSHGVIGNTAKLEYRNQSGAINESFADIFGAMIDRDDWKLAEDIVNTEYFPSGAMRDMQNPNNGRNGLGENGWQPKDMSEFYTGEQDNGGVHINSGILNRAYYLFATAIGKDKAEQVYYRALDNYLTKSSQFIDLRLSILRSATDLHGAGSAEVQAAETAFDTVGITDGTGTDTDNDIPTASGDDFILSLDIRDSDQNTLYISDTNGENFVPLTTTRVFRKPSVADDGSLAIFVTESNTVNAVTLRTSGSEETVLSNEQIWSQVSLSKDGTKLAAIRNDQSNIIYISDLISSESQAFELFNPTTSDTGITTGEVLYPDAIEWDYSGEYLIYDALNRIDNGNGNDIDYWDVGALKVWDNQSSSFGDGSIQKLFTNLPEGVSIGNPSFSKTSGNVLAFDVFDENDDTYEVIAVNIETGDIRTVYQNNKLGFPNYSKTDDKLIFDSFNNGDEDILAINLAADKISPTGNPSELIPNGKWGIWYTVGQRSTLSSEKEITDFRFNVVNPAAVGVINGNQISVDLPANINRQNLVATFANSAKAAVSIAGTTQQSGVNINDFTNAVVYRVTAEDGSTKDFTVTIGTAGPTNPNDADGDGVLDGEDQCPNTPPNTTVDATGCEIFSLPADNFRIRSKGESCRNSNNGSIEITAIANYSYTAIITGNGVDASGDFTNTGVQIPDLQGGTYKVCITVQGQAGYENCFDVVVAEPEALGVSSKTNLTARTVTLNLSGSDSYIINLNDEVFTTSDAEITLPIKSERTKLTVKTEKECQGVYKETIDLGASVVVYPNPVSTGEITVQLSRASERKIGVQLNTFEGRTVMQKMVESGETTITLNADDLQTGMYLLYITINGKVETYKIIKQ
ncbi:T9SS type A sorting domain-containing protein [Maribacter algarum]|uniref:T9SS type A sorting domain-containing protein n=1 Tax=Maribacter algarum (ex Zhang et al. 2020) TaxID=2578118 RepID=A0A5S3PTS3_9FLAO|nr:M4 family metallopeptidase [Maribacter algarum]TMM58409.1 T9SS type A sorting domain-containing protein [Maribacter algarum]